VCTNKCIIDGEPEGAVWPSKPEVLLSATAWEISLHFRRQTCNLLSGQVRRKCQQVTVTSMTTGNGDMTAKTGNSYTTGTRTNSVEIPTASQVFLTTASANEVSPSDCEFWWLCPTTENDITAVITGNTYISWTMTGRITIPTANLGFSATPSSKKLTSSDCDNDRQPEMTIRPIDVLGQSLQFIVVVCCRNHLATLLSSSSSSKIPNLSLEFRYYLS